MAVSELMRYIEQQAEIAKSINDIATGAIQNRIIFEEDIRELLERMSVLEAMAADVLREVSRKNGNAGQQGDP